MCAARGALLIASRKLKPQPDKKVLRFAWCVDGTALRQWVGMLMAEVATDWGLALSEVKWRGDADKMGRLLTLWRHRGR